jgi:AcrR family transcriptional regulator
VSTSFLEHGRVQQKKRTFDALLDATRELIAQGVTPTVEDAATAASVSRTTAYRYFPNQASLIAAAHPEITARSMLAPDAGDDPVERVGQVVAETTRIIIERERQQRATLRLSLELDPDRRRELPLRQGRVISWIHEALDPAEGDYPPDVLHALALAVRSATGIESLVWLTDIAGLDRDEARELMRWSARAMTRAALDGDPPPPMPRRELSAG